MRKTIELLVFMGVFLVAASAQEISGDRVTVPFSDPSRLGTLKVNLLHGGITVRTYAGRDIIVENRVRTNDRTPNPKAAAGLRRLDVAGLVIQEDNNIVEIGMNRQGNNANLDIQVPVKTNLKLKTVNGGNILVEDVEGEMELDDNNGNIHVTNAAGSVVAHSLNGSVVATLREVTSNKLMSFSSLNGNIDVTLPADIKADVKMQSQNGHAYTDFEIRIAAGSLFPGGNKGIAGSINGGGPAIDLRTLNGNVYVRKGPK